MTRGFQIADATLGLRQTAKCLGQRRSIGLYRSLPYRFNEDSTGVS